MKTPTNSRVPAARKISAATSAARSRAPKMGDSDNWDARLGFLMHDVSRLRRSVFDDFMRPVGITRSQWWIIAHLSRHDGMIQSDLANVLDLGKAALGALLDRLEASQFIERRPDATDRRVKRIYMTTRGAQTIQEMQLKSHVMSERILKGLSAEARRALVDNLAIVKSNLLALRAEAAGAGDD